LTERLSQDQGARRRLDFASGLVLSVLSLLALAWIIPMAVPGEASRGEVSPSFFPNLAAGIVLACSLALMAMNRRTLAEGVDAGGLRILAELIAWTVVGGTIWLVLARVGFLPASILATAAGVAVSRYRARLWLAALIALALPFLISRAVWMLFDIRLP
jgi:hypothetical protein